MADPKQSSQSRFLLAALLSMAVLFGWSYFFAPEKKLVDNANTAQPAATETPNQANRTAPAETAQTRQTAPVPDNVPQKVTEISSPLYKVKLDSKGGLATSWILLKSASPKGERMLYAEGSTEDTKKDLELIPPQALTVNPREIPFRLSTGDPNLDLIINERNYQVSAAEENVQLSGSETRQIDYVLRDEASGLEVTKTFIFRADSYVNDLNIRVLRNGQPVPNVKLLIGASIGDQSVPHHNYYHIEPEAVAYASGTAERHLPTSIVPDKQTAGQLTINGEIDWAGIGDTYFAMAAIPSQKVQGVEYRASKYEVDVVPFYDGIINTITRSATTKETRHLLTAYLPIPADGSPTKIYTGTKDYFVLDHYNDVLTQSVGRPIDIEDFINFSNYSFIYFFVKPISIVLLHCLHFINQFVNNYGIAIIVFTILFYSLLFPIRWYQSKSFKKAQKNAPKMKELQEKLKDLQKKGVPADDPRMRELQMEQLKMTKDAIPIGGCLPLLLQMPLLFALYAAVTISINFRQEKFLWLPDLSIPDPFYILPFLFAGSMFLSMLITPTTPTVTPEQQMQQNMMKYLMPVMMLWIGWSVPAGLLVYWVMGNVVSFVQQYFINKLNNSGNEPSGNIVTTDPKLASS